MATPSNLAKLRAERREAIRDVQESWGDMTPPVYEVHNHIEVAQPTPKPDSDPPATSGVAVTWKKGVKLGKLPPWATVVIALTLGLAAIGGATFAWIATH